MKILQNILEPTNHFLKYSYTSPIEAFNESIKKIKKPSDFNLVMYEDWIFIKEEYCDTSNYGSATFTKFKINILKIKNREKFTKYYKENINKNPRHNFYKAYSKGFEEMGVSEYYQYQVAIIENPASKIEEIFENRKYSVVLTLNNYRNEEKSYKINKTSDGFMFYNFKDYKFYFKLDKLLNDITEIKTINELKLYLNCIERIQEKTKLVFMNGKLYFKTTENPNTGIPDKVVYRDGKGLVKGYNKFIYIDKSEDKLDFLKNNNIYNPFSFFVKNKKYKDLFKLNFEN